MALPPNPSVAAIVRQAHKAGVPPNRVAELIYAAKRESGLRPKIRNRSSGAAGLFQLLSSGYVRRANQLGGVLNPNANAAAIMPNYASYWRTHPRAAPGAAAAYVEASGEPASWYAPPGGYRPPGGSVAAAGASGLNYQVRPYGGPTSVPLPGQTTMPQVAPIKVHMATTRPVRVEAKPGDWGRMPGLQVQARAQSPQKPITLDIPRPGLAAIPGVKRAQQLSGFSVKVPKIPRGTNVPISDVRIPSGRVPSIPSAVMGNVTTAPNVRGAKAELTIIAKARAMGLAARENPAVDRVDPVHVKGSDHYRTYPGTNVGHATDYSGSPAQMRKLFNWLVANRKRLGIKDVFYDPARYSVDEGKIWNQTIGGHEDHVHASTF